MRNSRNNNKYLLNVLDLLSTLSDCVDERHETCFSLTVTFTLSRFDSRIIGCIVRKIHGILSRLNGSCQYVKNLAEHDHEKTHKNIRKEAV